MMGWLGVFVFQFGWFANVLIIPAIVLLLLRRPGGLLSRLIGGGIALLLLNALFWREMHYDNGTRPIENYHIGYYLWFLASGLAAFALLARARLHEEEQQ